MRPEKLVLEGVYSYKKKTVIDFSTLCEAELFGIFGKVGSGKSAVLEAVTYVLFGKIERLPSKMMNYNMMNLSSDRMYIELEFIHRNSRYRFNFEAKRNRKDFEKIESPKRNAYLMEDGNWKPLFDRDSEVSAEDIIGLNYDNFRRTIIVPQGRFQEFLHLEKSKRTEMLMELFRLKRFDLYSKASSLAGRNSSEIAVLEERISNLSAATEEAIEAKEAEYGSLSSAASEITAALEKSDAGLNEMNELSKLAKAAGEAERRLDTVKAAKKDFERRRKRLAVYEDCSEKIKPLLDRYDELVREYDLKAKQLEEAGESLKNAAESAASAEAVFMKISEEYEGIEFLKKQRGWFEDLSRLEHERLSADDVRGAIESAEQELSRLRKDLDDIAARAGTEAGELEALGKSEKTSEQMAAVSFAFRNLGLKQEEAVSAGQSLKELGRRLELIAQQTAAAGDLNEEESLLEKRRAALGKKILEREILRGIGGLSAGLEPGMPCPVCGSTEHPAPADPSAAAVERPDEEEAALEQEAQQLRRKREELASLEREAGILESSMNTARETAARLQAEIDEIGRMINGSGYSVSDNESFGIEYRDFLSNAEKRETLLESRNALNDEKQRLSDAINASAEKLGSLRLKLGRSETVIAEAEARIDGEFLKEHAGLSSAHLKQNAGEIEARVMELEQGYERSAKARTETALAHERASSKAMLLESQKAGLEQRKEELAGGLGEALSSSGYESERQVRDILSEISSAADEHREIALYEKELAQADKELSVLKEQLAGRKYNAVAHGLEQENNARLREEYRQAVNRQGELGNILNELKQKLERKIESEKELQQLRVRGENLRMLKNLFRGNEFANYAARVYLGELCESANARFRKLTRESLRLELDDGNNFIIRDYLNEGKTRSVKTLSGGQTFQAAFSLSLALADSIGRERSGFFFLDEGFGSLDRESLSLVFETLKSLKKEKRTVGIISHVEELKQEIDTFITVRKDDDEGSLIASSWE